MTASEILAPLTDKSPEDLLADVQRVREAKQEAEQAEAKARATREHLEAEEAALTHLLTLVRMLRGEPNPEVERAIHVHARPNVAAEPGSGQRQVPKREPIMQLMREQPEHDAWTPREVRDALAERGIEGNTNLIRVTLRRMVEAGQLARAEDGHYRLAPEPGAPNMGAA